MLIVEIRCPRCGSISHLKNEKKNEYQCDHCKSTFVFVDTTKKEVMHDTRVHHCPICGRQVEAGEGFKCKECGVDYFCENCVKSITSGIGKILCKSCFKASIYCCSENDCYNHYKRRCGSCGKKFCDEHADYLMHYTKVIDGHLYYFSNRCPECGYICNDCVIIKKEGLLTKKKKGYCKKCGTRVKLHTPFLIEHIESNEISDSLRRRGL